MRATADSMASGFNAPRPPDYKYWTVEELREFGAQLQLPNARLKSRFELLEILDVKPAGRLRS